MSNTQTLALGCKDIFRHRHFLLKHIQPSVFFAKDLAQIHRQLFAHTSVEFFGYQRITMDGKWLGLYSDPDWIVRESMGERTPPFIDRFGISMVEGYHRMSDLKELLALHQISWHPFWGEQANAAESFVLGSCLIRKSSHYHEIFLFGGAPTVTFTYETIVIADVLRNFSAYFLYESRKIIVQAEKSAQSFFFADLDSSIRRLDKVTEDYLNVKERLVPKKISVPGERGETFLSRREGSCLIQVAEGYSVPEIATRMGLSRRTIESYVVSMRNKLGLDNREQLKDSARKIKIFGLSLLLIFVLVFGVPMPEQIWQELSNKSDIAQLASMVDADLKNRPEQSLYFGNVSPNEYFAVSGKRTYVYKNKKTNAYDGFYVVDVTGAVEVIYTFTNFQGKLFFNQALGHHVRNIQKKQVRIHLVEGVNDWLFDEQKYFRGTLRRHLEHKNYQIIFSANANSSGTKATVALR